MCGFPLSAYGRFFLSTTSKHILAAGNIVRRPDSFLQITVLDVDTCPDEGCLRQVALFQDPMTGQLESAHSENLLFVSARPLTKVVRAVK